MKVENLNSMLRELFNELINDNYKKRHVCGITLGGQNEPQFDGFMKGSDFGIKPLQRIIENMGYKFEVVIIPKKDEEITRFIDEVNHEFLAVCKKNIVEKLDDVDAVRIASIPKTGIIAVMSSELFDEITK